MMHISAYAILATYAVTEGCVGSRGDGGLGRAVGRKNNEGIEDHVREVLTAGGKDKKVYKYL